MRFKAIAIVSIAVAVLSGGACATKKYVRNRVNERVTPLENRTGELEETSRRNTQDISRIGRDVEDVRLRTDRAATQNETHHAGANHPHELLTHPHPLVSPRSPIPDP